MGSVVLFIMTKKLGILILTPFYEPNVGGVETHLKNLTDYLRKDDSYRVYVLTTKIKGRYFEKNGNIEIIRVPWIGFNLFHKLEPYPILEFLYITPWLFAWTFIFLLFKGVNIQVIHAQGFNASFITRLLVKLFKKKFIASTHAVYSMNVNSIMAKMVKWTLSSADRILTLSEASKKELARIGLNYRDINTYTYWVDQQVFKPTDKTEAKKKIGWENRFVVLFVGRFIEAKGTDMLLELAKKVSEEIYFAFIGDGPLFQIIKKKADAMNNVIFVGRIDNDKLPLYYSAADILCVPSKYEEGFGRVILEALSCGTPVVASNKGGIPEAIDETVGVLVKPTLENIKQAIECLHQNNEQLEKLRKNCRSFSENRFSENNAAVIVRSYVHGE